MDNLTLSQIIQQNVRLKNLEQQSGRSNSVVIFQDLNGVSITTSILIKPNFVYDIIYKNYGSNAAECSIRFIKDNTDIHQLLQFAYIAGTGECQSVIIDIHSTYIEAIVAPNSLIITQVIEIGERLYI